MSTFWIISIGVTAVAAVVFARRVLRYKPNKIRGVEPGQGDQIIDHKTIMWSTSGGHPTASRVSRDPQQYSKGFVPSSTKGTKT